ncbi:MAG: hypothetical protein JSW27_00325 [Phycisphaerales bacterium]|nr:MAG: hypothetical protein JSW27_00325 [Phycisphaerales bacterium]
MERTAALHYLTISLFLAGPSALAARADVRIGYPADSPQVNFAVSRLAEALRQVNAEPVLHDLADPGDRDVYIVADDTHAVPVPEAFQALGDSPVKAEGFQLARRDLGGRSVVCVIGRDATGAMYGTLDLAEQILMRRRLGGVEGKVCDPRFAFRAIKFNLPWSAYRPSELPAMNLHTDTCRDLQFWQRFLDMMAENRFNVLSLWNLHPFTYMIRPNGYPEACPFSDAELAQWRRFWKRLLAMAKERGIETYIVNWNIVVSPEFAKVHGVKERNDTSELVRDYTRQCVTQVIDEYDDLTGLGVTLADWMNDMTPKEREDWISETFVAGMKRARRPVKFIHRSVLAGSPTEMRRVIDEANLPDPVCVEVKFNWSHGHSTPRLSITHDYSSGQIDERFWNPRPTNYHIAWMIRNEDFFILRWGQPDFIRQHIAMNGQEYVSGYFIGSEGYIPAKEYAHRPDEHVTWRYAFERQWLFYKLWGRLLYDPRTPDEVFAGEFDRRCGGTVGRRLLQAYALASQMPLRLASFHAATWDYTLYSEGFLAPVQNEYNDKVSPFISIDELIYHETLDPTYLSIPDYVKALVGSKTIGESVVTPVELAGELERDSSEALQLVASLPAEGGRSAPTLQCEIADVQAWAHLSLYFAEKLRAAVALETFRQTKDGRRKDEAVTHLKEAAEHWANLVAVTERHYHPVPAVQLSRSAGNDASFSWGQYRSQVLRDIEIASQAQ